MKNRYWFWNLPPWQAWLLASLIIGSLIPIRRAIIGAFSPVELEGLTIPAFDDFTSVILLVMVLPIVEELLFRLAFQGIFLQQLLLKGRHPGIAILISATSFALVHPAPPMMASAFLLGLFISWIFWRSASIWLAIYLHLFNNLIVLMPVLLDLAATSFIDILFPRLDPGILIVVSVVITVAALARMNYFLPDSNGGEE
jgi:membrane protease YdiL (CAAX protease family)